MVFDRTENEPEEWDPEEEFYDPDSDGLTIPQVSTGDDEPDDDLDDLSSVIEPPAVSTAETDVPGDILQAFWALVLVLNAAVLAVSLGLLLAVFEGSLIRGGVLVAAGVVLFGLAGRRYRRFRNDDASTTSDTDTDTTSRTDDTNDTDTTTGTDDTVESDTDPIESTGDDRAETTSGDISRHQSPTRNDSP
ncbi:hypothetical protein [Natrinema sp. DC36]|uniref:DUF7322 domain-containing protein n=1 Tax=Natrinema sp. DC36 TaxID=2878680 RepID=UPI001CF05464|nr:hypothetical protein [Natrinema sp. DC36]